MHLTVPNLDGHTVLVVGDLMLDRYWDGDSLRISAEAPVPIVHVMSATDRPGGAANVALNVVALGARCVLVGAVGTDEAAQVLRAQLSRAGVTLDLLPVSGWQTVTKLRVTSRHQQVVRVDFESALSVQQQLDVQVALLQRVAYWAKRVPVAILQDYDKGTLESPEAIVKVLRDHSVRVVVDPKHKSLLRYHGAHVVKPNFAEFERNVGAVDGEAQFNERAQQLLQQGQFQALLITRGEQGVTLVEAGMAGAVQIAARTVRVFDVTGAGDTVAATLGVALANGVSMAHAAALANIAAGIAVASPGTVAVSGTQLRRAVADAGSEHDQAILQKAMSQKALPQKALSQKETAQAGRHGARAERGQTTLQPLLAAVAAARRAGQRIIFTNGCFDILHAGHVGYLQEARALGELLIVAVNSDASVTRLKGEGRPVNTAEQRMLVLAGLAAVDWVIEFHEDTPEKLLGQLRPDVLVKGGDYRLDEVVGADLVREWGGQVKVLALRENCSTTDIVNRAGKSIARKTTKATEAPAISTSMQDRQPLE